MDNRSKVIRGDNYRWEGVSPKEYKDKEGCYEGVHRHTLLGEKDDEQDLNIQTRYFEVEPGGYTSFEYHRHPHSVVVIRGRGEVILGNDVYDIDLHDVVYVAPDTPHQFKATEDTSLGFICVVNRDRDRPVILDNDYINGVIESPEVRGKIKR